MKSALLRMLPKKGKWSALRAKFINMCALRANLIMWSALRASSNYLKNENIENMFIAFRHMYFLK